MSDVDALIGSTGFVGGNLAVKRRFEVAVGSRESDRVRGRDFRHVVFSAARAEKWRANADPDEDARHVDQLIELAGSFTASRLTVVSTIDVYRSPRQVDETSPIVTEGLHAYGANRHRLEIALAAMHPRTLVVRLPALFGPGLKKNVVYDLLHDNQVDRIQPRSSFQYYDLTRLSADIDVLWDAGVRLANLVTEPTSTALVVDRAFGRKALTASTTLPVVQYDVRTRWSGLFAGPDGYIESSGSVLDRLVAFVRETAVA